MLAVCRKFCLCILAVVCLTFPGCSSEEPEPTEDEMKAQLDEEKRIAAEEDAINAQERMKPDE